jgi:beta-phosphoglucomutase-like phosphatase (HAD superfamily)
LDRCLVISNKWQDAEAALNAGCTSVLIASPWIGKGHHDIVLPSLADVAGKIAQLRTSTRAQAAPLPA